MTWPSTPQGDTHRYIIFMRLCGYTFAWKFLSKLAYRKLMNS
jgi:hypothetical protein